MKIWVDDMRPAPKGYVWCKSVVEVIKLIENVDKFNDEVMGCVLSVPGFFNVRETDGYIHNWVYSSLNPPEIELIDIDHDAGEYASYGGDYIKLLDWFEETGRNYPIHIHSMNPVGVANMRRIIKKNGWTEV